MTVGVARAASLQALVDRADRARAQAMVNHANLEQALCRAKAFDASSRGRFPKAEGSSKAVVTDSRLQELQDTVDGLMKRLESQGPIEQAKGIIMAQNHCDADQAFEILRRASQRSNIKLRLLAEDLVTRTTGAVVQR